MDAQAVLIHQKGSTQHCLREKRSKEKWGHAWVDHCFPYKSGLCYLACGLAGTLPCITAVVPAARQSWPSTCLRYSPRAQMGKMFLQQVQREAGQGGLMRTHVQRTLAGAHTAALGEEQGKSSADERLTSRMLASMLANWRVFHTERDLLARRLNG